MSYSIDCFLLGFMLHALNAQMSETMLVLFMQGTIFGMVDVKNKQDANYTAIQDSIQNLDSW